MARTEDQDIYRDFIIDLYRNPLNHGRMAGADYHARLDNPTCGDRVEIFIRVRGGVVADAKFSGSGCAISQASASLLTGYLKGRTLASLHGITEKEVLDLLKIDLSRNPGRLRCALLPLEAVRKALEARPATLRMPGRRKPPAR